MEPYLINTGKAFLKRHLPGIYSQVRRIRNRREERRGRENSIRPILWNNQLQSIINKIIAECGVYVHGGPFAGMMYWPVGKPGYWAGGVAGSLLGLYELELHGVLADTIQRGYSQVIDIGCAEGYYAVGLALRLPQAHVYAFDIEATARELCKAMALVNNVADRVTVAGECTIDNLRDLTARRCLIISDCEGCELDLLRQDLVPGLAECDILVELHDVFRPGLSEALLPRFAATHQIDIIPTTKRDPEAFPEIGFLTPQERQIALDERRPARMTWAMMKSRNHLDHSQ